MTTIWKYELPVDDQWHDLPINGPITGFGPHPVRNDLVLVWAVHNEGADGGRRLRVFGTGHELPENTRTQNVLSTVITADRQFVWHVVSTWYPGNE